MEIPTTTSESCPKQCETCPMLRAHTKHIEAHEEQIDNFIRVGTSDDESIAEELARAATIEMLGPVTSHFLPDGMEENMAKLIRHASGGVVESLNEHTRDIRTDMAKLAVNCKGVYVFTGSHDNRRAVSVTVCGSPEAPSSNSLNASVERYRL